MISPETLIAAFVDEDRRMREVVRTFPIAYRDIPPENSKLSLKQTLGHLAFWDRYTVEFFDARCHKRNVDALTLSDFENRNRQELERLYDLPFEQVFDAYITATAELQHFLLEHWGDLDEADQANFNIPLKHRRHHRRLLLKALEIFAPDAAIAAREKAG